MNNADELDNLFLVAIEQLYKPYQKEPQHRFWGRYLKSLPMTENSQFLQFLQSVIEFTKTHCLQWFDTFDKNFRNSIKTYRLEKLLLPPVQSVVNPQFLAKSFNIDWSLLTSPMRCAAVYFLIQVADDYRGICREYNSHHSSFWDLLPKPGGKELDWIYGEILEERRLESLEAAKLKLQQSIGGHDIETFRKMFITKLLEDPTTIDKLIYRGHFDVNIHDREECDVDLGCDNCVDQDDADEIKSDDHLGTVWMDTVNALGDRK